jgi:ASC-1-like (ASCH) protein
MTTARQTIDVYPFAYNKILGGRRKIDIRPYSKRFHSLRVGDVIDYVNIETKNRVSREVKGIALFDDFDTLIEMLSHDLIGYDNKEEIKIRVDRMYPKALQKENGVCALFIDEPSVRKMMKTSYMERCA